MPYRKRGERRLKDIEEVTITEIKEEDLFSDFEILDVDTKPDATLCIRPNDKATTNGKGQSSLDRNAKSCRVRLKRDKSPAKKAKRFKCRSCGKVLSTKSALANHKRSHCVAAQKTFECEFCLKPFKGLSMLRTHLRTHTRERPFKCEVCFKTFMQRQHLMKHRFIHTGERPFECHVCKKRFKYTQDLKRHSYIHTGERPYECSICQKTFNQSSALRVHERIHTGEKPYQCSICAMCFREQGTLQKHQRRHAVDDEEEGCAWILLGPDDLVKVKRARRE